MFRFLFLPLALVASSLTAQAVFNVRVGTFQDVTATDFPELRTYGFVYGTPREGQLTDVFVGNYASQERADEVVTRLREAGFRNAAPFVLPRESGEPVAVIQLALGSKTRTPDWPRLERAGRLHVDAGAETIRIVTGPYPTPAAATADLARIKELGFTDAFVKSLNKGQLIPVGYFETGIKKPLIPIEITKRTPPAPAPAPPPPPVPEAVTEVEPAAPQVAGEVPDSPPPSVRDTSGDDDIEPEESPTVIPHSPDPPSPPSTFSALPPTKPGLPTIDVGTKRHSAAELQRVLKEKGYYTGSIDGFYGEGTREAYLGAWYGMPELYPYRILGSAYELPYGTPAEWPEMLVLTAITIELAAGLENRDAAKAFAENRSALFERATPLPNQDATRARAWEKSVWENLDEWATEDPLHARMLSAFRVAYYQSQARLEAMYLQRGLAPVESRNLATAVLENVLAPWLDRFR
jgi:hypothetical protein